jgi:hypothetical protein
MQATGEDERREAARLLELERSKVGGVKSSTSNI